MLSIFWIDKIGCIAGILGAIMVGQIKKNGYLWFMLCNIAYGTIGFMQGYWGLVLVSIIMFAIDVYYYIKWGSLEKK